MSIGKLWLAVLMTAAVCGAADISDEVHIFVRGTQHVDPLVVRRAQQQASQMLGAAGVRIVWKPGWADDAACCYLKVVLEYTTEPHPAGVTAYAFPYGNDKEAIKILYRRIAAKRPRPEKVLAHIIVHEVTHVLQGIARHSDSGIMKARWDTEDYQQMEQSPLAFTATDIDLIQRGVAKRMAKAYSDRASGYNDPVQQVTRH